MAGAFVDASNIDVSREITQLLNLIPEVQLLPTPIQEQTAQGMLNRWGLIATDGSWQIILLSGRFDVVLASTNPINGSRLIPFTEFSATAVRILSELLERYRLTPFRLASVRTGFLREMSDDEMTSLAGRVLRLPRIYGESALTEWDWRAVAEIERRIDNITEPVNTITSFKRAGGIALPGITGAPMQTIPLRRVICEVDMNTLPTNAQTRFTPQHVRNFFEATPEWHREIAEEMNPFLQ